MIVVKGIIDGIECFMQTNSKAELERFQKSMDATEYMTNTYRYKSMNRKWGRIDLVLTSLFLGSAIFSAFALYGMYSAFYGGC